MTPVLNVPRPVWWPKIPDTLEALGVPETVLYDIFLRHAYLKGTTSVAASAETLRVAPQIAEAAFTNFRRQQFLDVKGMSGNDYSFSLTGAGRQAAAERMALCRYAGPVPVSIADYEQITRAQSAKVKITRDSLRKALGDLVTEDDLLNRLGPALISQTSLFLYGPTGNGKTSLAERLLRIYSDTIVIPYAVEVDGQIVILYDPVIHQRVDVPFNDEMDPRWVPIQRPSVIAGGELVYAMLELRLDDMSGTYAAPPQMKANNGVFIIDDFGRQVISARELLNRWIVPLDRRVDYLSLQYGVKFRIPFELMVVFSTNLNPTELADEAFLRRIPNKIYIGEVTEATFDRIFERAATHYKVPVEKTVAARVRELCRQRGPGDLRACYPGDICRLLLELAEYDGRMPTATEADLHRAVNLYFTSTGRV